MPRMYQFAIGMGRFIRSLMVGFSSGTQSGG